MRRLWVVICLLVPLGGCLDQSGGGRPPIVGPPKVVVNYGADNLTEIYVHASVGDINYTRLELRLDNATRGQPGHFQKNHSYALDVKTNRTTFHANVTVTDGESTYRQTGVFSLNTTARPVRIRVSLDDAGTSTQDVPYTTALDRQEGS